MNHPSIDLQGHVISAEVLDQLLLAEGQGQKPADFGLPADTTVDRAIAEAWTTARTKWKQFQEKRARISANGFAETRKHWIKPLLQEFGYELESALPELLDGSEKPFPIALRAEGLNGFPVHAVGVGHELDERHPNGGRVQSAHALLQDYLNHSEHVYGIVTNGLQLRLLRDSTRLGRLAYVEFDLERILEQEIYPDFQALYRLLHASRMPRKPEATEEALIERYHQKGIESGSRIREKLRLEVKKAMQTLANGLLSHNPAFNEAAVEGNVPAGAFYQALLRTVYRMLFLIVIEERDLVHPEPKDENDPIAKQRDIYSRYYSFGRLRKLALRAPYVDGRRTDLWRSLLSTFRLFENEGHGKALGIAPLGGDLFGKPLAVGGHDLHALVLDNHALLAILSGLTLTRSDQGALVPVNYTDLDVEELGSIYEGLLELHPVLNTSTGMPHFSFTAGSERKLTGSYYTRHDLVAQLIRTALLPVMDERLKDKRTKEEQAEALLSITVLDPACGSGHFLLAAARKLSEKLAQIRSGSENPGKRDLIAARREVISRCIHGVDKNPAAIELCRLALWLEAHTVGKPLTFLEHRIRPGDALVGVDKLERLREGIPDGAFKPVTGDHKPTASAMKKRNKKFRTTKQYGLFGGQLQLEADMDRFAAGYRAVEAMRNDDLQDRAEKEARYAKYKSDRGWWKDKVACDLFTYAFFQRYPEGLKDSEVVDTELLLKQLNSAGSSNAALEAKAIELSERERFFHWPLEFPDVWKRGGFDVVLANPPWEQVELKETEFFAERNDAIANAQGATRKNLIEDLSHTNAPLYAEFLFARNVFDATRKFIQEAGTLSLTVGGRTNLYAVFSEKLLLLTGRQGHAGSLVPSGIAMDDNNKEFFGYVVGNKRLVSLFDFQNATTIGRFFPNVHPQYKFVLLTIAGSSSEQPASFGFFLNEVLDINDSRRAFTLAQEDFLCMNPNTKTCPIFRTVNDATLTAKLYRQIPVLVNESVHSNPWSITIRRLFNMGMKEVSALSTPNPQPEPFSAVFESKMMWQYDHQYATYEGATDRDLENGNARSVDRSEFGPSSRTSSRLYMSSYQLPGPFMEWYKRHSWEVAYRNITNSTNERTVVAAIIPKTASDFSLRVQLYAEGVSTASIGCLAGLYNSLVFDFISRQKLGGTNLSDYIFKQLPVPTPEVIALVEDRMIPLVTELTYTSWDIKAFADDLWREADGELRQTLRTQWEENRRATGGHGWVQPDWKEAYPEIDWAFSKGDEQSAQGGIPFPPFKWDEERRAHLRAELDAYYALLYGLERDELRYILDPKEVHGEDFPGETFRVLKDKEIRQFGEYRTRRLVLEAYDRLRPTWDMPGHLERLRVEYERLQRPVEVEKKSTPVHKPEEVSVDLFNLATGNDMQAFSLDTGIYSINDAAAIVGVSYDRVRRWFSKLAEVEYKGLSPGSEKDVESRRISFHGLIELVVIGTLLDNEFSLAAIFKAREDLAEKTKKVYPFATNNVRDNLKVVGKAIIFDFTSGPVILNGKGQYLLDLIRQFFKEIDFDTQGVAKRLLPSKGNQLIVIDPKVGGGKPSIKDKHGIQVDTIVSLYKGHSSVPQLVENYDVSEEEVRAALAYANVE